MSQAADLWALNIDILFLMSALIPVMSFDKKETTDNEPTQLKQINKKPLTEEA